MSWECSGPYFPPVERSWPTAKTTRYWRFVKAGTATSFPFARTILLRCSHLLGSVRGSSTVVASNFGLEFRPLGAKGRERRRGWFGRLSRGA
jgi:hypothetical protein